jgi:sterol 3beta-glucosyltransferase
MSKIAHIALGSRGDVTPSFYINLELQRAGHEVYSLCPTESARYAKEIGLDRVVPIPDVNFEKLITGFKMGELSQTASFLLKMNSFLKDLTEKAASFVYQYLSELKPDVVILNDGGELLCRPVVAVLGFPIIHVDPVLWIEPIIGERHGVRPIISQQHIPFVSPARQHALIESLMAFMVEGKALSQVPEGKEHFQGYARSRETDLARIHMVDPELFGIRREDVSLPSNIHWIGSIFPPDSIPRETAAGLDDFLAQRQGDMIVAFSFGSMHHNPEKMTAMIAEAVRSLPDVSAILIGGSGGEVLPIDGEQFFYAPYSDYLLTLPKVDALFTHGGSGTVAAAMRSGTPLQIIPFIVDQPTWGHLVHQQGLGLAPVNVNHLTPQVIVEGIRQLQSDQRIRDNVKTFGTRMQTDALQQAVRIIEAAVEGL